jgi:predicted molibdopterin-dependent oxidoreductase YjgC
MFKRLRPIHRPVTIDFEGQAITAEAGESLAAALLAAGITGFRRAGEDGSLRGPLCMIGNCFDCLVWIEGLGSRQACRERVRPGLKLRAHPGLPTAEDLLVPGELEA